MALIESCMLPLGTQSPSFSLPNVINNQIKELEIIRGKNGTLIIFMCNHCPYVIHLLEGIIKTAIDFSKKGIATVAISSNSIETHPQDGPKEMKKLALLKRFSFPYLYDESQEVAKNFQAACTPDFYLFDNQLKLEYDADAFSEDEIIKKIEAGNVSLPLRSSLIQGAQSLFGLKTELQFGHLRITAIASQQKSKREAIEIKGGAQVQEFEVTGEQYDENRHFFLSHYHRDHFEEALQNMPTINSLSRITKIEVWVTNDRNETEGIRDIVALADLGEYDRITNDNMFYGQPSTPRNRDVFGIDELPENSSNDIYGDLTQISEARYADKTVGLLTGQFNFQQTRDFEKVRARLLNPSEYTYNAELGFVSVNVNLRADQVLAVSYEYNYAGKDQVYKVGELA